MPAYNRLTRQQRYTIEAMNRNRSPQKEIAAAIGVSASAVSRELRRNGMTRENYCYVAAQNHAQSREWKGLRIAPELWKQVETKLQEEQWSPEQISAAFAETGVGHVSHETIYQHIYRDQKAGGTLHRHLRHRCKSYRQRGSERERSWERGLNENTNGLIRQYFPKGSSFDALTIKDVERVAQLLNTRPRKCLAYQTPNDIFNSPPPIALAA